MTTVQDMHDHVMRLCEERQIVCSWSERPSKAWASYELEEICIPRIKSAITYATAMHEVGHILGRHQRSSDTMVRERWAWKWAKRNALIWTPGMERDANRSLEWYRDRKARGLLAPIRPVEIISSTAD